MLDATLRFLAECLGREPPASAPRLPAEYRVAAEGLEIEWLHPASTAGSDADR